MRISDWSSDVCSSDLDERLDHRGFTHQRPARSDSLSRKSGQRQRDSPAPRFRHNQKEEKHRLLGLRPAGSRPSAAPDRFSDPPTRHPHDEPASPARFLLERGSFKRCASIAATAPAAPSQLARSEEHTSELQSLMRISYAVFCLKKKKTSHTYTT